MTKLDYLISLVDTNPALIRDTWAALGSLKVTNKTKQYIKDTIFQVDCDAGDCSFALIYCEQTYSVDGSSNLDIDWSTITNEDCEGMLSSYQGVTMPYFKILLTGSQLEAITDPVNSDIIPFADIADTKSTNISIDDSELEIILSEVGVPFLSVDELEYTRDQICNICIRPVLDLYYKYFPIVEDQNWGTVSSGADIKVAYPEGAYDCIPYYVLGTGASNSSYGSGAFAFYREQMAYGGFNGMPWGNGLRYRKSVPGFVGGPDMTSAALMSMLAAQGYANFFRREHFKKVKIDGKWYATGFTTIGGNLNIKWLKNSYNFDDVKFDMKDDVRKLCTAYVLRNLGMLRSQVKSDIPSNLDFSLFNTRADTIEDKITKKWESAMQNLSKSIMRGGLN